MAMIAALQGSQDCVKKFVEEFDRRRRFIVNEVNKLPGFKCKLPKGAFYVFPNIKELKRPSLEVAEHLVREARVITVPGSGFGMEGYLRISYSAPISVIKEAVERVRDALEKL
jgi:aspartate aminotransferase